MKTIAFVDYENIWTGLAERGLFLNPEQLVYILQQYADYFDNDLSAIYLFANFDREEFRHMQTAFERTNVFTRHIYGKSNFSKTDLRHNATDIELMLEAQEILLTRPATVDLFLLLTGDGDFLSLIRKIRSWGKEVQVIGVEGSISQTLQPYCSDLKVFNQLIASCSETGYQAGQDLEQGIGIIGHLQTRLPYVASTKARAALSTQLGRSISQVKELIKLLLKEDMLFEREHPDASLKIGRTKIYLLNLENSKVKDVLGAMYDEVYQRNLKLIRGS
ncbi:MAG: NYN domain-containing protein [Desulfitobacteriaceae bacterium]|nr:NYN domain-containing protein [Desulfitobacteriaceae bacterium]MDD4345437.1 NYN domain-containing protein [Desulfitobacteriaceae bacterium]MDD4400716.1 NYN domain-containing protein [Desulfitobacteriaceae bacterium]